MSQGKHQISAMIEDTRYKVSSMGCVYANILLDDCAAADFPLCQLVQWIRNPAFLPQTKDTTKYAPTRTELCPHDPDLVWTS